jgi:hypothetical protein
MQSFGHETLTPPSMAKRVVMIAIVCGIFLIWAIVARQRDAERERRFQTQTRPAPTATAAESVTADCPKIRKELERTIIYKVDGDGYFVYVNRTWHTLMIDQKQSVAYLAATCYSKGTVRILDARTGKLLARWGTNGYVNHED